MLFPKQNQREPRNALSLNQRKNLEKFIQRPEPAGHKHKANAVLDEANLSRKEIMKIDGNVGVAISSLLLGQLDVEPHRFAFGESGPFVGCFHDAGATACDDRQIVLGQTAS